MLRPWIKFSSTGKMERKRKNESRKRREGKARGEQGRHRLRGVGGLGRYGSAGVRASRWGQYTPCHTATMPATSCKHHSYNRPHAQS